MVFKYKYRDLIVCEIVNVIILYKDFKFVLDLYVFNDGSFRELMNFIGIIFVFYRVIVRFVGVYLGYDCGIWRWIFSFFLFYFGILFIILGNGVIEYFLYVRYVRWNFFIFIWIFF